ncbi:hypothetical protein [Saccharothrix obliqua]|uniref:hypothetical protein n=1 Tax=Saccharothrix obliqua TaxID=2861747 RepID=UPI001C5F9EA7|nr:hypothetical protein [Saccharothrix obliqua]MBW4719977.1 hypothetical protein [Saccharothrix obliqua]
MLAEIIVSRIVGGLMLRRVGEVLVAQQDFNDRMRDASRGRFEWDRYDEILFEVERLEKKCISAWEACQRGTREWRHKEGLIALDEALQESTRYYRHITSSEG